MLNTKYYFFKIFKNINIQCDEVNYLRLDFSNIIVGNLTILLVNELFIYPMYALF